MCGAALKLSVEGGHGLKSGGGRLNPFPGLANALVVFLVGHGEMASASIGTSLPERAEA